MSGGEKCFIFSFLHSFAQLNSQSEPFLSQKGSTADLKMLSLPKSLVCRALNRKQRSNCSKVSRAKRKTVDPSLSTHTYPMDWITSDTHWWTHTDIFERGHTLTLTLLHSHTNMSADRKTPAQHRHLTAPPVRLPISISTPFRVTVLFHSLLRQRAVVCQHFPGYMKQVGSLPVCGRPSETAAQTALPCLLSWVVDWPPCRGWCSVRACQRRPTADWKRRQNIIVGPGRWVAGWEMRECICRLPAE